MVRGRPEPANRDPKSGQYKAEKSGCFIATAVYGDYNATEVITLRRFRDEELQKKTLGRVFVAVYYRLSPSIAQFLRRSPKTALFVRRGLDIVVRSIARKN